MLILKHFENKKKMFKMLAEYKMAINFIENGIFET